VRDRAPDPSRSARGSTSTARAGAWRRLACRRTAARCPEEGARAGAVGSGEVSGGVPLPPLTATRAHARPRTCARARRHMPACTDAQMTARRHAHKHTETCTPARPGKDAVAGTRARACARTRTCGHSGQQRHGSGGSSSNGGAAWQACQQKVTEARAHAHGRRLLAGKAKRNSRKSSHRAGLQVHRASCEVTR